MPSFDIQSKVDGQTLDNAVNVVKKEILNRWDFKGTHVSIELDKKENQLRWATVRSILELDSFKHKINGKKSKSHWSTFEKILNVATFFLKFFGIYNRGKRNALDLKYKKLDLTFDDLPAEFDGFSILCL